MNFFNSLFIYQLFFFKEISAWFNLVVDPMDIIADHGYKSEKYTVQTDDGYLLSLYRIPHGINGSKPNSIPILLNHGLSATPAYFVNLSPKRSLGYILADNGYDVWLMSCRGSTYSNRHVTINESIKGRFYNFSFHEVGYFDIPACIDFVLKATNQTKLFYFGHSQGGTTYLVTGATRPEYNSKIRLATLVGATYNGRNTHALIKFVAPFANFFKTAANIFGFHDNPIPGQLRYFLHTVCSSGYFFFVCESIFDFVAGYADHDQLDQLVFNNIFRTLPSNAALKQLIHYLQCVSAERFQEYDYGKRKNLLVYGSLEPPLYNISAITSPIHMMVGLQDSLLPLEDAEILANKLPNVVKFKIVENDNWNHGDFIYARETYIYVYKHLLKEMSFY